MVRYCPHLHIENAEGIRMSKQSITKRTVEMPPTSVERFMVNLSGDGVRRLLADKSLVLKMPPTLWSKSARLLRMNESGIVVSMLSPVTVRYVTMTSSSGYMPSPVFIGSILDIAPA